MLLPSYSLIGNFIDVHSVIFCTCGGNSNAVNGFCYWQLLVYCVDVVIYFFKHLLFV